jgi:hypothetical protein
MLLLGGSANGEVLKVLQSAAEEHRVHPITPTPTLAIRGDVRGRQVTRTTGSTTFTITSAPDATCGFLSGNSGVAVTCANGKKCAWEAEYIGAVFCGFETSDRSYLRCLPRNIAVDPVQCNDVCQSNQYNLLCTNTEEPFCRTYAFPDGVRDFRCASSSVTGAQQVLWTYSGQTNRLFTTSVIRDETTGASTSRALPGITLTNVPTKSSDPTSGIVDPVTSGPGPSNTSEPSKDGSGPPLGPIIGGVVGGVVVLALILVGLFFLIRRNRRNNENMQGHVTSPGVPPNQPSPSHYPTGSVGYAAAPQVQQVPGYQGIPPPGATSPAPTYDSTFKPGVGNMSPHTPSMLSMSPPSATHQEHFNPQWGPTPSPPPVQPGVAQVQGYPQQGVQGGPIYEIGTVEDQHKGRINELS